MTTVLERLDTRASLDRVLATVEAAAVMVGVALPDRRYVTVGGSVYDCPQVSVSGMSIGSGIVGAENGLSGLLPCPPVWNLVAEVAIVRAAHEKPTGPRGELPPTIEMLESDVDAASGDAAVLAEAASLLAGDEPEIGVPTVAIEFTQPQGGLIAVSATLTFNPFRE